MWHGRSAFEGLAIAVFALLLAGCGTEATPTTTTTASVPEPATAPLPDTTTATSAESGPQPLPSSGILEPGEYRTTMFEPTILFGLEQSHLLRPFQTAESAGFENYRHVIGRDAEVPHKGVAIHNWWLGLTNDEILALLGDLDSIELGTTVQVKVAGLPAIQIEAMVRRDTILWDSRTDPQRAWFLQDGAQMRLTVVNTPVGSLLVTVSADAEEWEEFLPVAEEILAGISFPDL